MALLLKRKKRLVVGLVIAITIGVSLCLSSYLDLLHITQLRSSDFLFQAANLQRETEPEPRIVIIAIDDQSLGQLGHLSSWPRSHYAHLIEALAEAQARVIVFDILFTEPAPGDEELTNSIRNAGNVILPIIHTSTMTESMIATQIHQGESFTRPLAIFAQEVIATGHVNVAADADGVVRRLPVAILNNDQYEPALALAAASKYLRRSDVLESPIKDDVLPFAGRFIPLSVDNDMIINYIANPSKGEEIINFPKVSFVDVLDGRIDPAHFKDRIVIIGATASGLADALWTPMGWGMNGVEIHASAIHTILTGHFLKPVSDAVTAILILVLALLCGLIVSRLRILWATLLTAFLCLVYFLAAFSLFDYGIMLNMLYPPLAIAGTFVGTNLYSVVSERSGKNEVTKALGRYISTSVANKTLASLAEGKLRLDGEECQVTVLFADVRNFTTISEQIPPRELVRTLNVYLSVIIKAVLRHDGMINKFGGDSVMALWNVPTDCPQHALFATKAAIKAQLAIRELQDKEENLPKMEFGIGINTGIAVAGNMGSEDRLEYSVIGDAVNTAARLADAAPGNGVWISEDTFTQVRDHLDAKILAPLAVKGKRKPIKAYEVLCAKDLSNEDC